MTLASSPPRNGLSILLAGADGRRAIADLFPGVDPTSLRLEPGPDGDPVAILRDARHGTPIALRASGEGALRHLHPGTDGRLPGRVLLADPSLLVRRLRSRLGGVRSIRLIAYRPGRRAVLRVRGAHPEGGTGTLYLKLLRRKTFRRARSRLAGMPACADGLHLALPDLWLDAEAAHAATPAPGRSLHDRLIAGEGVPVATLARALGRLAAVPPPPGAPAHGIEEERAATLSMLRTAPLPSAALDDLARLVADAGAPEEGGGPTGTIHRDLHDKQIFLGAPGEVTLIDLEGLAPGPPILDAVNLAEHLRLRGLQTGADRDGEEARADLLEALGERGDDPLVRFHVGLVRARLAGVYARRPRWSRLSARLAGEARQILTGKRP